jgi:hypothetical protein
MTLTLLEKPACIKFQLWLPTFVGKDLPLESSSSALRIKELQQESTGDLEVLKSLTHVFVQPS